MCLDCGGAHGENPHRLGRTWRTCRLHTDRPQLVELIPVAHPLLFICIYFLTLKHKMSEHQIPSVLSEQRFVYCSCFYLVWNAERCFEWLILLMKLNHTRQETGTSPISSELQPEWNRRATNSLFISALRADAAAWSRGGRSATVTSLFLLSHM